VKRLILTSIAVLVLVLPAGSAVAQGGFISIYSDAAGIDGEYLDNFTGLVNFYVVVQLTPAVSAVQFAAPLPACFTGALYIADTSSFLTMGNSQTGVAISLGGCMSSPGNVLTIQVFAMAQTSTCCPYYVVPDPAEPSGTIVSVDCNNVKQVASGGALYISDGATRIHSPIPADGAVDQSVVAALRWSIGCSSVVCGAARCIPFADVYFGTTPDPPLVATMQQSYYDPGGLAPNTTYYWKIKEGDAESPVWSFTTNAGNPVAVDTWGAIKALYR